MQSVRRPAESEHAGQSSISAFFPYVTPLLLVLGPLAGHLPGLLTGLSSNPIWSQSAVVSHVGQPIIPGWAFGDPNVGWTNQALGHLAASDWLHGRVPWWNPDSGIGLPLAGEGQSAALFLPFVLLLILHDGLFWLQITMQVLAGFATLALLRRLGIGRLAALFGALLFEFNGTFTWVPNEATLNVMPFLPMLLLGIEEARLGEHPRRGVALVAVGIGGSILAGFPEEAFINGLMGLFWFLGRLAMGPRRAGFAGLVIGGGVIGLLLAGPQLVSLFDYARQTDIVRSHGFGNLWLDPRGFAGLVVPYVFGPMANAFGKPALVLIAGGTGGYIAAFLLPPAVIGATARRDRGLVVILCLWILIAFTKTFAFQPLSGLMNRIPFMIDVMFYRYSPPSWELAFTILIARGLDERRIRPWRIVLAAAAAFAAIAVAVGLAWPWSPAWHWDAAGRSALAGWLGRAVGFELVGLLLVALAAMASRRHLRPLLTGAVLVTGSMMLFGLPQLSGLPPGRIDWKGIDFIKSHAGLRRFYSFGPVMPNYGAYFGLAGINHNYSPIDARWAGYVQSHLIPPDGGQGWITFAAAVQPHLIPGAVNELNANVDDFRDLGVNQIVTPPGFSLTPAVTLGRSGPGGHVFVLGPRRSLVIRALVPPGAGSLREVGSIGVFQGNFADTASGLLVIRLCVNGDCVEGHRNVSESRDNSMFEVPLDHPVQIPPGSRLTVTIRQETGQHFDAIWYWPDHGGGLSVATGGGRPMPDRSVRLGLFALHRNGLFKRVFHDRVMDVWRLKGAAPYFTVEGGRCSLSHARRNGVVAFCAGPARLVRRELFMRGWHASDDGRALPISPAYHIMQAVPLHAGSNDIRYRFVPPYAPASWIGVFVGILLLLATGFMPVPARRRA